MIHSNRSRLWFLGLAFVAFALPACNGDDEVDADELGPVIWEYLEPYADGNQVDWVVETDALYASLPAVDADGGLVFGDWEGILRRVNADTGQVNWSFEAAGRINAAPAIDEDGRIYFADWTGVIYALDNSGDERWRYDVDAIVDASPSIDDEGNIFVGDDAGIFYFLSPAGELLESLDLGASVSSAASILIDDGDVTAFVATADNQIHCLMRGVGPTSATLQGQVGYDIALTSNGNAVISTHDGGVAKIDSDCEIIWEENLTWAVLMPGIVAEGNDLWVWGHNRQIYRIDGDTGGTDGQMGAPIRGNASSAPIFADDGRVLVGTQGVVHFNASDSSGVLSEVDAMDTPVLTDGSAFVTTERGVLLRLAGSWPAMGDSSWPTQHGNLARTGRLEL